jgi:hypothetical protein
MTSKKLIPEPLSWYWLNLIVYLYPKPYWGPNPDLIVYFQDTYQIMHKPDCEQYILSDVNLGLSELIASISQVTPMKTGELIVHYPQISGLPVQIEAIIYDIEKAQVCTETELSSIWQQIITLTSKLNIKTILFEAKGISEIVSNPYKLINSFFQLLDDSIIKGSLTIDWIAFACRGKDFEVVQEVFTRMTTN